MFDFLKTLLTVVSYELDFFKVPFPLLIGGRQKFPSGLGSLFTFLMLVYFIYMIIESNMLLKVNPSVIDQTLPQKTSAQISLNFHNFNLAFAIADQLNRALIDPSMFTVRLANGLIETDNQTNEKYVKDFFQTELHICNSSDFSDPKDFKSMGLKNYYCPDQRIFNLVGDYGEDVIQGLTITVEVCNNDTMNGTCAGLEAIRSFASDKNFIIYYTDHFYDVNVHQEPIEDIWKYLFVPINTNGMATQMVYFKKLVLTSDENLLFSAVSNQRESFMTDSVPALAFAAADLAYMNSIFNPIVMFNFASAKNNQKVKRTYQKIGELIANISGTLNVFIFFAFIATGIHNKICMQNYLLNQLYFFNTK